MAMKHNYITGSFNRPVSSELSVAEIVINQTDGTLWTKRPNGSIVMIDSSIEDIDTSWKFIGAPGQPRYENNFTPMNEANLLNGISYRLVDNNTLQITGGFVSTRNLPRGSHRVFTFGNNIVQRLVGLNHQFSTATINPTLNALPHVILNVNGFLDVVFQSSIFVNDIVMIDSYFQLN